MRTNLIALLCLSIAFIPGCDQSQSSRSSAGNSASALGFTDADSIAHEKAHEDVVALFNQAADILAEVDDIESAGEASNQLIELTPQVDEAVKRVTKLQSTLIDQRDADAITQKFRPLISSANQRLDDEAGRIIEIGPEAILAVQPGIKSLTAAKTGSAQ